MFFWSVFLFVFSLSLISVFLDSESSWLFRSLLLEFWKNTRDQIPDEDLILSLTNEEAFKSRYYLNYVEHVEELFPSLKRRV